jgi:outer membrane receptor protein involved in Fe transport
MGVIMNMKIKLIGLLLVAVGILSGATAGKISGRVLDAERNQPLTGANVIVEGTSLGSFTDDEGYYVILNVPPGSYRVRFSMIGYGAKVYEDVVVAIDLTSNLDVSLSAEAIELQEIVALAERPVIQKDIAASQMDVSSEVIETLPVANVSQVVGLQAGIEGMTIRGSASYQTAFMVDGLSFNDERSNTPYTSLSLSSIKEVKIQTGGFNAEYDNVRAGVVNVVTKEGDRDRYSGSFTARYNPPASKHFGPSVYDPMDYHSRSYNDDDVAWLGTYSETYTDVNGNGRWDEGEPFEDRNMDGHYYQSPWDMYMQASYPKWKGFNQLSVERNTDDDPDNDMTAGALQRLYQYQHRRQGDIRIPDYTVDVGFGGPVPGGRNLGNLRFFLSHRNEQTAYIVPLSRDSYNDNNTTLKLTSDVSPKIKLTLTGMYGEVHSVSQATWTTLPTGDNNFYSTYSVANAAGTNYVAYVPGVYNPTTIYRNNLGLKWSHQLSGTSFYEANISRLSSYYYTDRVAPRDTTKNYELFPGYFVDEFPNGYWPSGAGTVVGMRTDWMGFAKDRSRNSTTTIKADYTNQIDRFNQIKTGIAVILTEYKIDSWNEHSNPFWTYYNEWYQNPFRLGLYIQDKIEFEGLIINAGIRFDYSDANAQWFVTENYDPLFQANVGFNLEELAPKEKSKGIYKLSPRLAISHPISENAKIYFNYGHFNALPQSQYRFTIDRLGTGAINRLGDPELEYSTTIAYELGFERNLFNTYLFKMAGYYKDISNQPSWTRYASADASVAYYHANTNSYADIRGLEITLTKNRGAWFTGFINYTYHIATSGYFGLSRVFEDPSEQRQYLRENPYQSRPRPQPFARMSLDLHTPGDFSPLGIPSLITGNWNVNLLANWKAGAYDTYNVTNEIGVVDNVRWVDFYNADLRFSKSLDLGKSDLVFFLDITNVFNIKRLSYTGIADTYDRLDYLASLRFDWEEGAQNGDDKIGMYRAEGVDFWPIQSYEGLSEIKDPKDGVLYFSNSAGSFYIFENGQWLDENHTKVSELLDDKAYINMPNIESLTFRDPRAITLGLKINF